MMAKTKSEMKIMPEWLLCILLFWPMFIFWGIGAFVVSFNTHLAMIFLAIGFFGESIYLPLFLFLFGHSGEDC